MSVIRLLPVEYNYKIIKEEFISNDDFKCCIRSNIKTGEEFKAWLKDFAGWTNTTWILRNSREGGNLTKFKFSRNYLCQHSSYRKVAVNGKDKGCEAKLSIRIKYDTKFTRLRDRFVKKGLLAIINITFKHSHAVDVKGERNWLEADETNDNEDLSDDNVDMEDQESQSRPGENQNTKETYKLRERNRQKKNPELTGRRIVDISFFIQQIQELSDHGGSSCSFKDMVFVCEMRRGLNCGLKFRCEVCSLTKTVWTDAVCSKPDSDSEQDTSVNAAAVAGMEGIGGGYARLQRFLAALSIPCLSRDCYLKEQGTLMMKKEQYESKMAKAAEEKKALEKSYVDTEDSPMNALVADRTWDMVPHGKNLQSLPEVSLKRQPEVLNVKPRLVMELEPNMLLRPVMPSDLIGELDTRTIITPDIDPPDLSEPGPSSRVELDSTMMVQDVHNALTCEKYPADAPHPDFLIKIKKEPIDPDPYKHDILSGPIGQKLNSFSNESFATSKQEGSLFHPPVLIKEEPVCFEEEM